MQQYTQARLFKELGLSLHRSVAEMPARLVDAFSKLESERLRVEMMRNDVTRGKDARDPD